MNNDQALVHVIRPDQARVNITYAGRNGDLPDPVLFDSNDNDLRGMIAEALRAGSIPGIDPQPDVDLRDFVVDRFETSEARPYNLIQLRPKTPFGMVGNPLHAPRRVPTGLTGESVEVRCPTCGR